MLPRVALHSKGSSCWSQTCLQSTEIIGLSHTNQPNFWRFQHPGLHFDFLSLLTLWTDLRAWALNTSYICAWLSILKTPQSSLINKGLLSCVHLHTQHLHLMPNRHFICTHLALNPKHWPFIYNKSTLYIVVPSSCVITLLFSSLQVKSLGVILESLLSRDFKICHIQ